MEKWFVIQKGADFQALSRRFGISPVTARLIRNREVIGEEAVEKYLKGSVKDLYDPHLLKDVDRLVEILAEKIAKKASIRIIGDYVIDGVTIREVVFVSQFIKYFKHSFFYSFFCLQPFL